MDVSEGFEVLLIRGLRDADMGCLNWLVLRYPILDIESAVIFLTDDTSLISLGFIGLIYVLQILGPIGQS